MIQFSNVSFGYSQQATLFNNLNINLLAGNIYGLLGPNGAGKSSFLRLILGLLYPNEGEIEVLGHSPKDRKPSFLENVYFLPEEFHTPAVSLREYANIHVPFYPNFDYDLVQNILEQFEVNPDTRLDRLSLGEKKKAFIAFGLATKTPLLIMDEPTNGLDIPSKSLFRKIMAAAASDNRLIIISTHQVRDLESLIDPILILNNGRMVLNATVENITKSLIFKGLPTLTAQQQDEALYIENTLRGQSVVLPNHDHEDSRLDLELLFQAAMHSPEKMNF